jgi:hypothetical protein
MEMTGSRLTVALLSLLLTAVTKTSYGASKGVPKGHAEVNTGKWRSIALPFRPYNVTAFNGTLWVCGLNETIAVSNDMGISWRVQHQRQDGEVLLKIAPSHTGSVTVPSENPAAVGQVGLFGAT